ncbi:MAG: hypothetical protein ACRDFB_11015, partial [Rhabdochlamydiaceae bacterium]
MNKIDSDCNVIFNIEYINYLNLKEQDTYTMSLFEELQQQCFAENMDYYICVVRQNDRNYLFDASKFIEHCIREQKIVVNPLTQQSIENFEIYVSSKEAPDFKLYMQGKEVMTPPNHLPILWSDASREPSERLSLMQAYCNSFENKDIQKIIEIYKKAAALGSAEAKLKLVKAYAKTGQKESISLSLLNPSIKELFVCAYQAEDDQDDTTAFKAYKLAANRGNLIGLVEVIHRLEQGVEAEKNLSKIAQWRQQLPEGWKDANISSFFEHLKGIGYSFDQTGYP